jgi:glycosyltransferase involved in cell wall biosynthesis
MKLISVLTPCYNEEKNIELIYSEVKKVFDNLPNISYEHIFIDNASTDKTIDIIKDLIKLDKNIKLIVNKKNFGWVRSPYHGILQCYGDAVIYIVADLQDPPILINKFIEKWHEGYKIVIGIKESSDESKIMFFFRSLFYSLLKKIANNEQIKNFTGYGLYDKEFIDILRNIKEPYPFFRGLIGELGFDRYDIIYKQPIRKHGKSSANFFHLYDMAMLGFISSSKLPLRISSILGFAISIICLIISLLYFVFKLIFWSTFSLGLAPIIIGLFFFAGVQLFFLGIIGEYIGSIYTEVKNRPLVIEKERINF